MKGGAELLDGYIFDIKNLISPKIQKLLDNFDLPEQIELLIILISSPQTLPSSVLGEISNFYINKTGGNVEPSILSENDLDFIREYGFFYKNLDSVILLINGLCNDSTYEIEKEFAVQQLSKDRERRKQERMANNSKIIEDLQFDSDSLEQYNKAPRQRKSLEQLISEAKRRKQQKQQ